MCMPKTLQRFYQAQLRNNCPECYSTDGLSLEFHQEWNENRWIKQTTHHVKEVLHCDHCKADIFPVNWTEDIERVYQYHLKLAEKPKQFKLKNTSWGLIILGVLIIGAMIFAYMYYR